ncbi:hypothetical protein ACFE04_005832 [Oxalis oulophora]
MAHTITATTRRTIASLVTRVLNSSSSTLQSTTYRSRFYSLPALLNNNHSQLYTPNNIYTRVPTRLKTSGSGYSPLNDPSPNWSNRPPKETILLDGCDYEHWLIVMEFDDKQKPSEEEMINAYVNTLTSVVGSEEEAKKKIYSVCTSTYTGFGALISEELSNKVKGNSFTSVPKDFLRFKDYLVCCGFYQIHILTYPTKIMEKFTLGMGLSGDLFVDGKVIHRPQYRVNERQPTRSRPRPRHDRRQETMQVERRQPMPNQSWSQGQNPSFQQQPPAYNQNSTRSQNPSFQQQSPPAYNPNSAQGGGNFSTNNEGR